ncbi:MAG: hypothetical protein ACTSO7_17620, partial [Candidatus Heimdallarchaeota archaeon]
MSLKKVYELSKEQKKDLENRYENAMQGVGGADIKYVIEKFEEKWSTLKNTNLPQQISDIRGKTKSLYEIVKKYNLDD